MSCTEPFTIYATEASANEFLGFRDVDLHGQSVSCLCGPLTDRRLLAALISEAQLDRSVQAILRLCDKSLIPRKFMVTSAPFYDDSRKMLGAILSFEEDGKLIEAVMDEEPTTLVHSEAKESKSDGKGYYQSKGTCAPIRVENQEITPVPSCQGGVVTINARRKLGVCLPIPVAVSLDTVAKLQHLPAHLAAARIGISLAALKRACRKLGVRRWAYKKTPRGGPSPAPPPSASATDPHSPKAIAVWQHAPGLSCSADSAPTSDDPATPTDPDSSSDGSPGPAWHPSTPALAGPDDLVWLTAFNPHHPDAPRVDKDIMMWREAPIPFEWTPDWCGEEAADEGERQRLCGDLLGWADDRSADS